MWNRWVLVYKYVLWDIVEFSCFKFDFRYYSEVEVSKWVVYFNLSW